MTKKTMKTTALMVVALALFASAAAAADVRVLVSTTTAAGGTRYHYRIVNNSSQRIVSLQIGYDYPHGVYALNAAPIGWSREGGIPASSVTSPTGWSVEFLTTEETDVENALAWRSDEGSGDVMPGQTKSGFSIAAPTAPGYSSGIWTAVFGNTSETSAALAVSGMLETDNNPPPPDLDTTPPTISVALSPTTIWPPNHKLVPITAQVQVSDDRDPHPQVRLVSIESNEGEAADVSDAAYGTDDRAFSVRSERLGQQKQGRVYTVKYSATDAAGNIAYATATVTIPHDQR